MSSRRGFTLLEVLVAISILGLGLTTILSAQTGLFASSHYAEHVSLSIGLLRCRMSEIELKLAKEGYPLVDQKDEGQCCGDEGTPGYRCKWKIEKIELPMPPSSSDLSSKMGTAMSSLGPLGALASVGQSNGAVLGQSPQLGDVSRLLAGSGATAGMPPPTDSFGTTGGSLGTTGTTGGSTTGGSFGSTPFSGGSLGGTVGGGTPGSGSSVGPPGMGGLMGGTSALAPLVMGMVYPSLKPMLEASIRKLTVSVEWKDGSAQRKIEATEYVTNPQQGGLDPNAAAGLGQTGGLLGGATTGTTAGTTGGTTTTGGLMGGMLGGGGIIGGSK